MIEDCRTCSTQPLSFTLHLQLSKFERNGPPKNASDLRRRTDHGLHPGFDPKFLRDFENCPSTGFSSQSSREETSTTFCSMPRLRLSRAILGYANAASSGRICLRKIVCSPVTIANKSPIPQTYKNGHAGR
jgi:hypothetical protein